MNRDYRAALLCGALPLASGVGIFLAWIVTRWGWLMHVGGLTLFVGTGLFVVGSIYLAKYVSRARCDEASSTRRGWLSAIGAGGLLLANFPAAGAIVLEAIRIDEAYVVVVRNETKSDLTDVRVFGGGCDARLGTIRPGRTERCTVWIQQDGEMRLQANQGGKVQTEVIDGYVTGAMGGLTTVTVHEGGRIDARHAGRLQDGAPAIDDWP